jgi:hypothetical protein
MDFLILVIGIVIGSVLYRTVIGPFINRVVEREREIKSVKENNK